MDFLIGLFALIFFSGLFILLFVVLPIALSTGPVRREEPIDEDDDLL